jgi:magnesium-transporting ATPase (P-type)
MESLNGDGRFHELVLAMALCHDVVRDVRREEYQGSSPDEVCFVNFASSIGYIFEGRSRQTVSLEVMGVRKRL